MPVSHHAAVRVVHVHAAKVNHRTVQSTTESRTHPKVIAPTVIPTCPTIRMTIGEGQGAINHNLSDTLKMA